MFWDWTPGENWCLSEKEKKILVDRFYPVWLTLKLKKKKKERERENVNVILKINALTLYLVKKSSSKDDFKKGVLEEIRVNRRGML